jgi:hypothetical protein
MGVRIGVLDPYGRLQGAQLTTRRPLEDTRPSRVVPPPGLASGPAAPKSVVLWGVDRVLAFFRCGRLVS